MGFKEEIGMNALVSQYSILTAEITSNIGRLSTAVSGIKTIYRRTQEEFYF